MTLVAFLCAVALLLVLPITASAQGDDVLVESEADTQYSKLASTHADAPEDSGGLVVCTNDCNWEKFVQQLNRIVTWLIALSTAIAVLFFTYAGFIYLTSGGDQSKAEEAKGIFSNVVVGFGIILIAYLLVTTIVRILTSPDADFRDESVSPVDLSIAPSTELAAAHFYEKH